MKKIEELFCAIFVGIVEAIVVKIVCMEMKWSIWFLVFVAGVLLWFIVLEIIRCWKDIKIFINNSLETKVRIKRVNGFFGREEIVKKIIHWHRKAKEFQIGVIYGFGGSGKTKLAKEFGKSAGNYCYSIYISNKEELPKVDKIHNNTIVFIDYVYEFIKDKKSIEQIKEFMHNCKNSKKKISLMLLERTNLVAYVLYALDLDKISTECINLNKKGVNNEDLLKNIFQYRLQEYDDKKIIEYVNLISNKFDYQYSRPIFAHIMSDLILDDSEIDFANYNGKNKLIEEYWKYRLKRKSFDSFLYEITEYDGRYEDVNTLKAILIDKAEAILLFAVLTSFNIVIDDTTTERRILIQYRNGEIYHNQQLVEMLNDILTFGKDKIKIRNMMLLQLFPLENSGREVNKIRISIDTYDIISSWLLTHFISRTQEGNAYLVNLIKCVNKDVGNIILSFVTRGAEDDRGASLLWWEHNFLFNAFVSWQEKGYEEWIKNCIELYANSEPQMQECILKLLKQFLGEMNYNSREYSNIYRYIRHLENDLKASGKKENARLIEMLDMQHPFDEFYGQDTFILRKRSEKDGE